MGSPTPRAQASSGHRVDAKETELHLLPPFRCGERQHLTSPSLAPSGWG